MLLLLLASLLALVLVLFATMDFSVLTAYTASERQRRIEKGEKDATEEAARLADRPAYEGVRLWVCALLIAGILFVVFSQLDIVAGVGVLLAGLLVGAVLRRLAIFRQVAEKIRHALSPLLAVSVAKAGGFFRAFGGLSHGETERPVTSREELRSVLTHAGGLLSRGETERLLAGLDFNRLRVSDVCTPRAEIDFIPADDVVGPLVMDDMHRTGHGQFPVIEGDLDHIVGILYLADILDFRAVEPRSVRSAMRTNVGHVQKDQKLSRVLGEFLVSKQNILVVVDDAGATVGLLTLRDVLEALVGSPL